MKFLGVTEDEDGKLIVEYEDMKGDREVMKADFLIGADGPSSAVRNQFAPEVQRRYAGYVAWRGNVKEDLISKETLHAIGENVAIFHYRRGHILHYRIPGYQGSMEIGERDCNVVWYHNVEEKDPPRVLTDSSGHTHAWSLGVGKIDLKIRDEQRKIAGEVLNPPMNEIFQKIEQPFVHAVTDNLATKAVFMNGKVIIVGDAVAGLRPHTTGGLSQGCMHALLLKRVFGEDTRMRIEEWERSVLGWANTASKIGVELGNMSQFADHPLAEGNGPAKL